ncbi:MAG TPA: hypothetical protein VHC00_01570 [Rhizobiaceae bacterium]|nr:hypothetical protein [Rhizobiaceae bacterium]
MKITEAGIDRIKISNSIGGELGAQFIIWLYFQVDESGRQTGQELVVTVPYDPDLTFNQIAREAFAKAAEMLRAGCALDEDAWWRKFNKTLEPLPNWAAGPQ